MKTNKEKSTDRKKEDEADSGKLIPTYMDLMPNNLKTEGGKRQYAALLKSQFETKVNQIVERHASLPAFIVHQGEGFKYTSLLVEARELFTHGYFYSCVAMCGMATERIAKDLYASCFTLPNENRDKLITILEHLNFAQIVKFLTELGKIDKDTAKAMGKIENLRNNYIHVKGPLPEFSGNDEEIHKQKTEKIQKQQQDAENAIRYLHKILEGTFSLFKNHEIRRGQFVPKGSTTEKE